MLSVVTTFAKRHTLLFRVFFKGKLDKTFYFRLPLYTIARSFGTGRCSLILERTVCSLFFGASCLFALFWRQLFVRSFWSELFARSLVTNSCSLAGHELLLARWTRTLARSLDTKIISRWTRRSSHAGHEDHLALGTKIISRWARRSSRAGHEDHLALGTKIISLGKGQFLALSLKSKAKMIKFPFLFLFFCFASFCVFCCCCCLFFLQPPAQTIAIDSPTPIVFALGFAGANVTAFAAHQSRQYDNTFVFSSLSPPTTTTTTTTSPSVTTTSPATMTTTMTTTMTSTALPGTTSTTSGVASTSTAMQTDTTTPPTTTTTTTPPTTTGTSTPSACGENKTKNMFQKTSFFSHVRVAFKYPNGLRLVVMAPDNCISRFAEGRENTAQLGGPLPGGLVSAGIALQHDYTMFSERTAHAARLSKNYFFSKNRFACKASIYTLSDVVALHTTPKTVAKYTTHLQ